MKTKARVSEVMKSLEDRAGDIVTDQQLRKLNLRTFWKFAKEFKFGSWLNQHRTINYGLISDSHSEDGKGRSNTVYGSSLNYPSE